MSFAVIHFNCQSKYTIDAFKSSLQKDFDLVEWRSGVYSVEIENAKEVIVLRDRFKKNINVKVEWAATEEKILDIIENICKNKPMKGDDVPQVDWN
jgi:hypothetical protein